MPKSTFIICEKSYIVRKGLISIIEKIPNTQIVQQFDSEDEMKNLSNIESDFIVINPNLLNKETINILQNAGSPAGSEGNSQFISLSEKSEITDINWVEFININDSQNTILTKLKTLIGNKETNESKSKSQDEISKREVDILKNIALGLSNKEIADKLFISTHTVVTHRKNITRKLGIKTVPGLTIYAILNKIININDTE
ncbi:MAG: LuxR C-terminal-related transcriptional regulator [Bacteroidales bacterium]|jgi:DNA-binding NarL/FixJ family response regulator|nr:LuxR C-terminal-related transcriptional regulator [Bacteroidales bacterium]